jgi:D-arabinose 1-dehydrogenase-like Zn-dependent alcohol dehydrogenase
MYGPGDVRVEQREEPLIVEPTDAIIRVSAACVCARTRGPAGAWKDAVTRADGHEYAGIVEKAGNDVRERHRCFRWGPGGHDDGDRFVLAAQPGKSQERPQSRSGSQPMLKGQPAHPAFSQKPLSRERDAVGQLGRRAGDSTRLSSTE